ncbi:MAG: YncE family protein, partial [Planctomycetota bacterium]
PAGAVEAVVDLNPHLDYSTPTVDQGTRDLSIGDPRGLAWSADGSAVFVTGMGSDNLVAFDTSFGRTGLVEVGAGPTGVVLDEFNDVLYVLNRFEATISRVDASGLVELDRTPFFDPTPDVVRDGRPFLYDTHLTSGLGQASCASCHIDGRMDQLAWDLGDPSGEMKAFNQVCNFGIGGCEDWHPMKGPMVTQTLQGILETGPLHWRADREDLAAFNGAFVGLMGRESELTTQEMDAFEAFVGTIRYQPNPFRTVNNDLPAEIAIPDGDGAGDPNFGRLLFRFGNLDGGVQNCVDCHAEPTGTNGQLTSATLIQDSQSMKIAQLRNMHEKTGYDQDSQSNNRGFGYTHDGAVDSLMDFLLFPAFQLDAQGRRDVTAFMLAFDETAHAGIGAQATMGGAGGDQAAERDALVSAALATEVDLVAKGVVDGEARGYLMTEPGTLDSDRVGETTTVAALDEAAAKGSVITWTLVDATTATRLALDRDLDGHYDRDELDTCADPADPESTPDTATCGGAGDANGDGVVDVQDLTAVIIAWGECAAPCPEDFNDDGIVDVTDLVVVILNWS